MRKVLCVCLGLLCTSMLLAGPPSTGVTANQGHSQVTAVAKGPVTHGNLASAKATSVATPQRLPADLHMNSFGAARGCTCPAYMAYIDSGYYFAPGLGDPSYANEITLDPGTTNISCIVFEVYVPSEDTNVTFSILDGGCFSGTEIFNSGPIGPLTAGGGWIITLDLQPDVLTAPAGTVTVKEVFDTGSSGPMLAGPAIIGNCPDYFCWYGTYYWFGGNPHSAAHVELYTDASPCEGACCLPDGTCYDGYDFVSCVVDNGGKWFKGQNCSTFSCPQPPPNDACENAFYYNGTVPFTTTFSGSNVEATNEADCLGWKDVWVSWTQDTAADVTLDLCSSPLYFGTIGIAYTYDCPCTAWYSWYTWDWNCGNPTLYNYGMAAGTYYYPLYSELPYQGDYVITLNAFPPPQGACCIGLDCVGTMSKQECQALGGHWFDGQDCATFECPPPPPYDLCQDPFSFALVADVPVVWTGDNTGASEECSLLSGGAYRDLWAYFTTTETLAVTIEYCGTTPAFYNAYIVIDTTCPCSGAWIFTSGYDNVACGDGNWSLYWGNLPAGAYYWPLLTDSTYGYCEGPFTVTFKGSAPPPPPECPEGTLFQQAPPYGSGDPWSAYTSGVGSTFQHKCFDTFGPVTAPICDVHFWGLWLLCCWSPCEVPAEGIPFLVEFYNLGDIPPAGTPPSGNCCYAWGGPGCEDPACQDSVCSYDSYCCNYYWDSICASEAATDPNCDCSLPPPTPVCSYNVTITPTALGSFGGYGSLYEFSADLDPCCNLGEGWVTFQSQQVGSDCVFLWLNSPNGDFNSYQLQYNSSWVYLGANLAYCLTPGGAATLCGDANCDGVIDNFDIDAFVLALTQGQAAWEAVYDCNFLTANDTNCDGSVDNFDIDSFVYAISNGECPPPCK